MRPHIRALLCLLAVLTAAALALALGQTSPSPVAQKPPANDAVRALLKERLAALEEINDLTTAAYNSGQLPLTETSAAHTALLKGQLDLCETNAERVKVHEGMVQVAEELVKTVRKMAERKLVSGVDVIKAEVQLLDAKIGLEKAKAEK